MDRCFAPMVNWWCLAEQVLKTELPAWHVQMAFEVFKSPCPLAMSQGPERCLTCLAQLCQVKTPEPLSEYVLMLPGVNDVYAATGTRRRSPWRRQRFPCKHLLQVLACYSAYAGSSHGVEQQFSQQLAFCHLQNGSPWRCSASWWCVASSRSPFHRSPRWQPRQGPSGSSASGRHAGATR